LVRKSKGDKAPFVGVAGIPGGGKSTFCKNLAEFLKFEHGINALVIPMDGYHYSRSELDKFPDPIEAHARRGAEFTFDGQKFVKDIK
jgi:pantothenate kinase